MKNILKRLFVIAISLGAFAVAFAVAYAFFMGASGSTGNDTDIGMKLTKEQYLKGATAGCTARNLPEADCHRVYSCLLDKYGVDGVYELDKQALNAEEGQVPDELLNKTMECM